MNNIALSNDKSLSQVNNKKCGIRQSAFGKT